MITGNIYAKEDISIYPEAIQKAIRFFQNHDLAAYQIGEFELDGEDMILQVIDQSTRLREELRPEIHRRYVDVQYLAAGGPEQIGWYPDCGNQKIDEELLETRDIIFYKNDPHVREGRIEMEIGSYAAFFPWDVHIPGIQAGEVLPIRKIVMKVAVHTL